MKRILKIFAGFFTPLNLAVIAAGGAFFWFLLFGEQGLYQLNKLYMMKKQFIKDKETLTQNIERLDREKKILSDPKNLEPTIRKELGYIKDGEVIFQIKDAKEGE